VKGDILEEVLGVLSGETKDTHTAPDEVPKRVPEKGPALLRVLNDEVP
jgi:hypothetical protein